VPARQRPAAPAGFCLPRLYSPLPAPGADPARSRLSSAFPVSENATATRSNGSSSDGPVAIVESRFAGRRQFSP
jgi:hypothetical protein